MNDPFNPLQHDSEALEEHYKRLLTALEVEYDNVRLKLQIVFDKAPKNEIIYANLLNTDERESSRVKIVVPTKYRVADGLYGSTLLTTIWYVKKANKVLVNSINRLNKRLDVIREEYKEVLEVCEAWKFDKNLPSSGVNESVEDDPFKPIEDTDSGSGVYSVQQLAISKSFDHIADVVERRTKEKSPRVLTKTDVFGSWSGQEDKLNHYCAPVNVYDLSCKKTYYAVAADVKSSKWLEHKVELMRQLVDQFDFITHRVRNERTK